MCVLYLYDAAVDAVVGVPEAPIVPPLPDCPLRGLGTALLQHGIHRKDALSGQTRHQLTANTRTPRLECYPNSHVSQLCIDRKGREQLLGFSLPCLNQLAAVYHKTQSLMHFNQMGYTCLDQGKLPCTVASSYKTVVEKH